MKQIITFLLLLMCITGNAQMNKVSYTYDQAGNRITRTITLNSAGAKQHTETTDSVVVKDMIGERTITVYPNPTKGALGIEIAGGNTEDKINIILFNGQGQALITAKAYTGLNNVDLTLYPVGWYVLQVVAGTEKRVYKIVKE